MKQLKKRMTALLIIFNFITSIFRVGDRRWYSFIFNCTAESIYDIYCRRNIRQRRYTLHIFHPHIHINSDVPHKRVVRVRFASPVSFGIVEGRWRQWEREEGVGGGERRRQLGGLLCLLITRRRHICIHVRASPRLAALTFSLNVIVCNNLMPPVSLRSLLQQATSPLSLSLRFATFLTVAPRRLDCLFWCSIVVVVVCPTF